ncbi:hypothetical Protein YC6258_00793 [Gynuella sunshinyii YC6258]|uniref:Uncharacterized protein n=1 Tax=Gynuella sunshinyii YC6258 TaxID=1445510 RepID=A0A0C5VHM4_9GAMM|nr:hypothetical Protein YC6258_00793 [Gynuella sunshinyii YC6258]
MSSLIQNSAWNPSCQLHRVSVFLKYYPIIPGNPQRDHTDIFDSHVKNHLMNTVFAPIIQQAIEL